MHLRKTTDVFVKKLHLEKKKVAAIKIRIWMDMHSFLENMWAEGIVSERNNNIKLLRRTRMDFIRLNQSFFFLSPPLSPCHFSFSYFLPNDDGSKRQGTNEE